MPTPSHHSPAAERKNDRLRFKRSSSRSKGRDRSLSPRLSSLNRSADESASLLTTVNANELNAEDEEFYSSGPAYHYEVSRLTDNEHDNFAEHVFDALADEEGREYWQTFYEQPIPDVPQEPEMTDDEYAAYIRRSMWEKQHGERAKSQHKAKRPAVSAFTEEVSKAKSYDDRHIRQLNDSWKAYLDSWKALGSTEWTLATIPWPTMQATYVSLQKSEVLKFMAVAGDAGGLAREELRRRWHPDRFQQKAIKYVVINDRTTVTAAVTLIAQILNEIIAE